MPQRKTPDPLAQKVGARVRDLRIELGMSLGNLAAASGVSKGHLSSVENGRVKITVGTAQNIARGLGVELVDLVVFPELGGRHELVERTRRMSEDELRELAGRIEREVRAVGVSQRHASACGRSPA